MNKYGFQKLPINEEKNHIFGSTRSLGGEILQSDADWTPFLPSDEFQNLYGVEPYACASFGTLNCVETLANRLFGFTDNFSDRFLAKNSGTDIRKGNDPHTVAEYLRKQGSCLQPFWDFTPDIDTFDKFYATLPQKVKTLALEFISEYNLGHEYVTNTSPSSLKNALQYSPIGISVYAWVLGSDGIYYKPQGVNDCHWCMLYKIEDPDIGYIFDSYDNSHKKYHLTNIEVAKRYSLTKQADTTSESWAQFLLNLFKSAWPF